MKASTLNRVFKFDEITLPDIKGLSNEQVIEHYSTLYPELTCGFVKEQKVEGENLILTISSNVGTKG